MKITMSEETMNYGKSNAARIMNKFGYISFSRGAYAKGISEKCLSNFYPVTINIEDHVFTCSEQIFMAYKAKHFKSKSVLNEILNSPYNPKGYKRLGRSNKIKYNDEEWKSVRIHYMYLSLKFKFENNLKLKEYLLDTGNKLLVECNEFDRYWSCGLSELQFQKNENVSSWTGENILGFLLMELRDELRN